MSIKGILFPFRKRYKDLQSKWWHRLLVVAFAVFLCFYAYLLAIDLIEDSSHTPRNTNYVSLAQFTKEYSGSGNAIKPFLAKSWTVACLQRNTFSDLYTASFGNELVSGNGKFNFSGGDFLANASYCNANLRENIPDFIRQLQEKAPNVEKMYKNQGVDLTEALNTYIDRNPSNLCIIHPSVKCGIKNLSDPDQIVIFSPSYKLNLYVLGAGVIILRIYLLSLFIQFLYYFGLLYVILGKENG